MISNPTANFRVTVPFPVRNTQRAIRILDRHLKLGFSQRVELAKARVPYLMPHDYSLEYATALAREFDSAGVPVRVSSSIDGDVTGDILGRKEQPAFTNREPSRAVKRIAAVVLGVVVGIVVIVVLESGGLQSGKTSVGQTSNSTPEPEPVKPISLTANQLFAAYQRNEIQADNIYKGRKLLVIGSVDSISKDFKGSSYLVLSAPNMFMSVHSNLVDGQERVAAGLEKGQRVSPVTGVGGREVGVKCSLAAITERTTLSQ